MNKSSNKNRSNNSKFGKKSVAMGKQQGADKKGNTKPKNDNKEEAKSKKAKTSYNKKLYFDSNQRKNGWLTDFSNRFKKQLSNTFQLKNATKVIVAVSGGVDSVVLLDILFQMTEYENYQLYICHFNHKIRPLTSDRDEEFVTSLAKRYGINIYVDTADVKNYAKKNSQSIELAARNLRYTFFERIAKSLNISNIALAHTADDSAETVLFNLIRGSGLTGLSGIPKTRNLSKKIQIIRPFLAFRKNELLEYAKIRNLRWKEDETNSLTIYTRNKIRNDLLKKIENEYNPQIIDTLNRTASIIYSADSFIKEHIKPYLKSAKWNKDTFTLYLQIQLLKTTNPYLQGEIIQNQLESRFRLSGLTQSTIERVLNLTNLEAGSVAEISKDIIALRDRNQIIITRARKENKINLDIQRIGFFQQQGFSIRLEEVKKKSFKLNKNPNVEYFDLDKIPALLTLRTWANGDIFKPLGMKGSIKVSDFLINNKISLFDKKNVLVLSSKSDIIWVCGHRINEDYKVTDSTTRFLKISFEEKSKNA